MKILTLLLDIYTVMLRLLEAEGRILRRAVMNLGWGLACVAIAAVLILVASGFFLMGIYQYLAVQTSPVASSLLLGLLALIVALIFAGLAKWLTADPKE
jgi:hypothetical protein